MFKRGGFIDNVFQSIRTSGGSNRKTAGTGGTNVYGGYVEQREKSPALQGRARYKTFSEMIVNTTILGAGVRLLLNLISKPAWKFEPATGDDIDLEEADRLAHEVERILTEEMATPWPRIVRRLGMFKMHGFSIHEWTARRRDDGTLGFVDIEVRPQITIERWDLDEVGTVFGVMQRDPQTQRENYLPRSRLVYLVDDAINDSPEGLGLLRHAVEAVRRLERFEQLEGYAFESDLRGVPIARAPLQELRDQVEAGTMKKEDADKHIEGLDNFLKKHILNPARGLMLESQTYEKADETKQASAARKFDIELLTGGSTSQDAVNRTIERINREVARVLGVEGILLGEGGTGSLALSRSKAETLAEIVDSALNDICAAVRRDVVRPLFVINGWDEKLIPTVKTEALQHRTLEEITTALRDLAASPLDPADEAFGEILDLAGLTRISVEDIEAREVKRVKEEERMLAAQQAAAAAVASQSEAEPNAKPDAGKSSEENPEVETPEGDET